MIFTFAYGKPSFIDNSGSMTKLCFSPDLKRKKTFFSGKLKESIIFREAICALHDVVISDLRYQKKDRSLYLEWLHHEELKKLAEHMAGKKELTDKLDLLTCEYRELANRRAVRWKPYWDARNKFRRYLENINPAFRFVFDPVITVHPDELFFECFSRDESTYAKLSAKYDLFENIKDIEYGTTNIDFSSRLFLEMEKIRTYKDTIFEIDPEGFQVETAGNESYKEKKIDMPDSWVRGFLQVQSAMSLPMVSFDLSPADIYNICFFLRSHREQNSPRALRYELTQGKPVKIVMEPWECVIESNSNVWEGENSFSIRTWGRRRLNILEGLIPVMKKVRVYLLGNGLPSFYVIYMDNMVFTLGLSGWTSNDWTGQSNFDLLSSRAKVDVYESSSVLNYLKERQYASLEEIVIQTKIDRAKVSGSLNLWCQSGKVTYDLASEKYRYRELTKEQIPLDDLAYSNEREKSAGKFIENNGIYMKERTIHERGTDVAGKIQDGKNNYSVVINLDRDDRITNAICDCYWHKSNGLYKGPCEHIIALRMFNSLKERKIMVPGFN